MAAKRNVHGGSRVTMFSTPWCGYCRRLKHQFEQEGIPYEEINVDDHQDIGRRIVEKTGGFRTVPTVEVGGELLVNPTLEQVRSALSS